jgi:pSer/pThr/pTyr-binding forkhead associated (FHA) protein
MVQLEILSGKTAGAKWAARRFPVRIGRSVDSDFRLEEQGVWDEHFQIALNPGAGFVLKVHPDALVVINGQPAQQVVLRNGDRIELGAVKLRFWLSEASQRGVRFRESLVWAIILGVSLAQVALIYWLLQ